MANPSARENGTRSICFKNFISCGRRGCTPEGGGKFPDKILELAQRQPALSVVRDEIGSPTYVPDLVDAIAQLIQTEQYGVYHLVNAGACSRYEWAVEILRMANVPRPVKPILLADYSRASTPPTNGALENFAAATVLDIKLRSWQEALGAYFGT